MNELQQILIGESFAAPPSHILEGLTDELVHRKPAGAPHSIYEELWHTAFWQQVTLDWIKGIETPIPPAAADGFPTVIDMERESWLQLCERFFQGANEASAAAGDPARIDDLIRCPSRPGYPVRVMSVRDQLENMGAHNAYHLGRIVLLRQLLGVWPPRSGGFTW
jgi:DinB superfamily